MNSMILAANIGAIATLLLGMFGLIAPRRAAAFTSIAPLGANGLSELRATYGGLFVALGAWCLLSQSVVVFTVLGVAWSGAALGRLVSVIIDGNRDQRNLGGLLMELVLGLLMLTQHIA